MFNHDPQGGEHRTPKPPVSVRPRRAYASPQLTELGRLRGTAGKPAYSSTEAYGAAPS
jgi:hypothetical protein